MSIQIKPIETFGSPLSEVVSTQLKNRSRINLTGLSYFEGRTFNIGNGSRGTDDFLKKQLFNTSWINLISSVNNIDDQAQETDKDSNLARRLVLSGGTLKWDGEKFVKSEGIDLSSTATGTYGQQFTYNRNSQTGVRPMPGITGFQIVSKNLNGTIREATIQFNVWSLPELEDIEKLYLRPGYHVITEWGHTYGLDKDGNPSSFPVSTIPNYSEFFEKNPADKIYEIIEQTIDRNYGNYDAFLGIVKNFSWSFRQDGGYDCSISVISKGEILDSLSVRSGLTGLLSKDEEQTENDFLNSNILTQFIKAISSSGGKSISSPPITSQYNPGRRLGRQAPSGA